MTKANSLNASVLASKFDETAEAHLNAGMDAKEQVNVSVLNVWADLVRLFTSEVVRSMPRPGTDEKTYPDNPDVIVDMVQGVNGMKKQSVRFSWVLFDKSPLGLEIQRQIDGYTGGKNKVEGTDEAYKGLGKDEYKSIIATWTGRKTAGRNMVSKAIQLEQMFDRIGVHCPSVGFKLLTVEKDDEQVFSTSTKPVKIYDESVAGGDSDVVSVGSFLTLKPERAAANNEPTFKGLMKTMGSETVTPTNEAFKIETVDQFDMAIASIATFFKTVRGDKKLKLKWLEQLNEAGNESLLSSLSFIESEIDNYTSIPAVQAKMEKAVAGEVDAPNESRRERLAKAFAK